MAKFYVQSGTFRRVVAADSCRKAALWAVHEVMQQIMPTDAESDCTPAASPSASNSAERVESVTVLSAKVRVDERGFDRPDASELSTMEVVAEWNQMVLTLDRLQRMLDGTVASPRVPEPRFSDDSCFDDLAA